MKIMNDFLGEVEYTEDDIIIFTEGIFGFEDFKEYVYISNPDPTFPFEWLQSIKNPDVSFIVTNPFLFVSDYDFNLPDSIIEKLEIKVIDDVSILSIVVIPDNPQDTTINLKSPVVVNKINRQAKQVILDEEFTLKHKIFTKDGPE
eukprot:gnl/Carplike_NY0171/9207_a12836_140.p1 GENE.gnl/Carplike_NY0171/9207_a12836_140~~gnl/Carplike_NY0171/9207_a12836_140.p1  ORF type:complete len:146 (+),score=9.53 gnl/Carplike_NY0171/9207_a12836_140:436-873(+)